MRFSHTALSTVCAAVLLLGTSGCQDVQRALGLRSSDSAIEEGREIESIRNTSEDVGSQSLTVTDEGNRLVNETAGVAITLPDSWTEASQLNREAQLQASDPDNNLFILVMAERDESLLRLGLDENATKYRELLIDQLADVESSTATDVAFVGRHFASQYEIRGQLQNGTPVVYLHTTVLTEEGYYQIVAWTTPEQYPSYKSDLQTITDTFREIEA